MPIFKKKKPSEVYPDSVKAKQFERTAKAKADSAETYSSQGKHPMARRMMGESMAAEDSASKYRGKRK